jgi:hypothetical protein
MSSAASGIAAIAASVKIAAATGVAALFAATVSPDFATLLDPPAPEPCVRRAPSATLQRAVPRPTVDVDDGPASWRTADPLAHVPGENAWGPKRSRSGPRPKDSDPVADVCAAVRGLMNKLPSIDSVLRNITELQAEARTKRGSARDSITERRLAELKDKLKTVKETRAAIVQELTNIPVATPECGGAFVETFISGILPAHSSSGGKKEGEHALFEASAQLCSILRTPSSWPKEEGGRDGAGSPLSVESGGASPLPGAPFVWGCLTFSRALLTTCQRHFQNFELQPQEYTPYVKFVAHLILCGSLPREKYTITGQSTLILRIKAVSEIEDVSDDRVCYEVRNLRVFLKIINPPDALLETARKFFVALDRNQKLPFPGSVTLSPRARTEAQIFLADLKKLPKRTTSAPRSSGGAAGGAGRPGNGAGWRSVARGRHGRRR